MDYFIFKYSMTKNIKLQLSICIIKKKKKCTPKISPQPWGFSTHISLLLSFFLLVLPFARWFFPPNRFQWLYSLICNFNDNESGDDDTRIKKEGEEGNQDWHWVVGYKEYLKSLVIRWSSHNSIWQVIK